MTHPGTGSTPPPGWYPDPADPRRSRWWDGVAWTNHYAPQPGSTPGIMPPTSPVQGPPAQGASPVQWPSAQASPWPSAQGSPSPWTTQGNVPPLPGAPAERPKLDRRTPVLNPYIWGVVLLPLLSLVFLLAWNPELRFRTVGSRQVLDPTSMFTPWYFAIGISSFLLYGVSVLLAYLDWQKLSQDGVVRPFHWAWCFLSPAVYVIGRSVIVHGVSGRGLAPVWALIGTFVLSTVVAAAKASTIMAQLMSSIPR
ncbi:DUF2510 domain-containing protein [Arthrobacter silvisoli]|uniref:DUF2510 domain-containing protein n=1 Tax=Arthrobacter silvisoli TaxID=2291022 RepID=UPI000E2182EE|nr:DUF2510 domain-containing protein [Arthrobacter silvisoli]